jgi:hypothetical protein
MDDIQYLNKGYEMAFTNAEKLGRCLGVILSLIKYSSLNNDDWKPLAILYIDIQDENEWNQSDFSFIRDEAARRGINVG